MQGTLRQVHLMTDNPPTLMPVISILTPMMEVRTRVPNRPFCTVMGPCLGCLEFHHPIPPPEVAFPRSLREHFDFIVEKILREKTYTSYVVV